MITQNSGLRRFNIHNFSLPAWAGRLPDGRTYNTCPAAGVCAAVCYARHGTYRFPQVKAKHERNLARILDDLPQWEADILAELAHPRFRGGVALRVHDSGDYFSDSYTLAWLRIARAVPDVLFYSYTKEVDRFRRLVEPDPPANFRWVYSYGGKQDHLLDPTRDRVADVFPTETAIAEAGWNTNADTDLDAVLGPNPVGMAQNNIPHLQRRIGARTFREWQAAQTARTRTVSRTTNHR
ncbi:GP88 family protein [Actinosynnema sp. CS-041913]|uniref:GP88 family protein n=1 Tax=Actinosynnema sp. CS-041913 TaxID=3239917 RepID=UPI003D8B3CE9